MHLKWSIRNVYNQYIQTSISGIPWCSLHGNNLSILKYAVWGGDPVYPTINYVHDPDEVADYRGPEFHEPTPEVVPYLMEVCRSASTQLIVFHNVLPKIYWIHDDVWLLIWKAMAA